MHLYTLFYANVALVSHKTIKNLAGLSLSIWAMMKSPYTGRLSLN